MENNNTISQVVKDDLCTGCGTCVALCPEEAIEMMINAKKGIYVPELDEENCNNCGTCYKVCPGHEVDFKGVKFRNIRKRARISGGLVTQFLIFALEEGIIDGALVTRMKRDKTLESKPFIARTREELVEASRNFMFSVEMEQAL